MANQMTSIVTETLDPSKRLPIPEELRLARGLFVGLALSAIIWLSLLILWMIV